MSRGIRQMLRDEYQRGLEQGRLDVLNEGAPRMLGTLIIIAISAGIGFVVGLLV